MSTNYVSGSFHLVTKWTKRMTFFRIKGKYFTLGGHPFSMYAKFSEKITFLPPNTHTYVCVSGSKKC